MAIYIQNIETLVPKHQYLQETAGALMASWTRDSKSKRYISKIYQDSGIEKRHTVISDLSLGGTESFFKTDDEGYPVEPTTSFRNRTYSEESKKMFVELAEKLVNGCPTISKNDITHVVTVSCTGFYNPGPDIHIVEGLGLPFSTERYHIGFMGCYGAFPAMRMAKQFCEANPKAVVLIVCLEFCTLHLQLNGDLDSVIANSLFADGAAGAIVSATDPVAQQRTFRLNSFASSLVTKGANDMAWTIGDRGFEMVLSKYVPKILGSSVKPIISNVIKDSNLRLSDVSHWAVHPGGKSILDKVQEGLNLSEEQISSSRRVLRQFGNMSSATILFVLKEILKDSEARRNVCAMAFGPGLSVESAMLETQTGD